MKIVLNHWGEGPVYHYPRFILLTEISQRSGQNLAFFAKSGNSNNNAQCDFSSFSVYLSSFLQTTFLGSPPE